MMIFAVILVITTVLNGLFLFAHYWLLDRAMQRQHALVLDEMKGFFNSPGENEPSQFALLVSAIIDQFSSSVVLKIKTTLMGVESVATKKAQQVAEAVIMDTNPMASALLSSFPSLSKVLRKNPGVLSQLGSMKLPGFGGGSPGGNGGDAGHYNPNKFNG